MQEKNDIQILTVSRSTISETRHCLTIGDSMISAGFPSPTDDFHETFDLVSHIVKHPSATFFMRVAGDSMTGAGIFDGDMLVVDRSLEPESGDIVVAILNGEFTIKRFQRRGSSIELLPENPKFRKITLNENIVILPDYVFAIGKDNILMKMGYLHQLDIILVFA